MEFEGRGREAGADGFGMTVRFLAEAPAAPGRPEVDLRDPSRALAFLGELGSKVTEESLKLMPILLSLLKHDAAIVVRQSIVSGTRFFCTVLEEISLQRGKGICSVILLQFSGLLGEKGTREFMDEFSPLCDIPKWVTKNLEDWWLVNQRLIMQNSSTLSDLHQIGNIVKSLEDMWAWMIKFKDAICGLALEPGSVSVRALAVKFLEVYILLLSSDSTDHAGYFAEDNASDFNISQLIGVHRIFEPALLLSEMNKSLGHLVDLLQSASSCGSLTIVIINCLAAIARKRPVHYSQILSALLDFDPDSQSKQGSHITSIRYSLKTTFIGFLRCTGHPSISESRDRLLKALRSLNPGESIEQIIRQVDKMSKNADHVSRDSCLHKDEKTLGHLLVSGDAISKRSMMQANDGATILSDVLVKRSRHSMLVNSAVAAPVANDFARDDADDDVDAVNGFSSHVSFLDSDLTPAEKMIVMIGALLAQGERGAESLEILISQMQPDLLADIVMFSMKHLPKSPLPLFFRLGSYATRSSSSDSSLQMEASIAVTSTSDTFNISSQILPSPPSTAILTTSTTDVPSVINPVAEARRDPRRDPRRLDPRLVTGSVGTQPMALNLENGHDVQHVLDGSLSRPMSVTVAMKTDSSLVPMAPKNEVIITENFLSLSADAFTVQESLVPLDQPMQKGPCLAVQAASDIPFSPIHVDQDLEPSTPSEATGNDGIDISIPESDQHSSAVSSVPISEKASQDLPLLPLFIDLSDEQRKLLSRLAIVRITESYKKIWATGGTHARLCLLGRLISQVDADADVIEMLQKYIIKDYHHQKGHEPAMHILYHLHSIMVSGTEEQYYSSASGVYEQFFLLLAKSLCSILPASDKSFSRLLNEAPLLPDSVLNLLEDLCHAPGHDLHGKDVREGDRITQGLGAVWSLILARPHTRRACLDIALRCAVDSQDDVRGKAIRLVANKLYPLSYLTENIEQFAKSMVLSLVDQQPPEKKFTQPKDAEKRIKVDSQETSTSDSQTLEPGPVQPNSQRVPAVSFSQAQYFSSLFFALCIKKPSLLQLAFDTYRRASKAVKQSIHWHVPDLVRKLGSSCSELLHIISVFPEGSENLIMLVLQIMTEEMTPSADLIATVKHLHETKFKDAIILIPILSSLSKDEVLPIFPRLVDLPMGKFQMALARILQGSAHTGPALSPAEVLIAIHDINPEKDGVALKKIMDACTTCFEQRTVFTQHVLVKALNELIERTPLPLLFMRTVIQAIDAFPTLVDFVMEILSKLVGMQIWRMPKLWPGFLKCASQTQPHSFHVLLQLPSAQLENVLQKHANLRGPLSTYANQANIRGSLPRSTLEVLGLIDEQQLQSR